MQKFEECLMQLKKRRNSRYSRLISSSVFRLGPIIWATLNNNKARLGQLSVIKDKISILAWVFFSKIMNLAFSLCHPIEGS